MKNLMGFYKVIRMIIVTVLSFAILSFVALYVILSIPSVHDKIRGIGEDELSKKLGTEVHIGKVSISPFHDVVLTDVYVPDQKGDSLLYVQKLGAGFSIYNLLVNRRLVFTYGEIIGMKGKVNRATKDSETNLQFVIDALSSKDKTKPPTKFDIKIYNLVIRKSELAYDVLDQPHKVGSFDTNHIDLTNLRADIALPTLKNNDFKIDVKRISFEEKSGFELTNLASVVTLNDNGITLQSTRIELPNSLITNDSIGVTVTSLANLKKEIKETPIELEVANSYVTLNDLKAFVPALSNFNEPLFITAKLKGNAHFVNVSTLDVSTRNERLGIEVRGQVTEPTDKENVAFDVPHLVLNAQAAEITKITSLLANLSPQASKIINACGNVKLDGSAVGSPKNISFDGYVMTSLGDIDVDAKFSTGNSGLSIDGDVETKGFKLGKLISKEPMLGDVSLDAKVDLTIKNKVVDGAVAGSIPFCDFKGYRYKNIVADVALSNRDIEGDLTIEDPNCNVRLNGMVKKAGAESEVDLMIDAKDVNLAALHLYEKDQDKNMSFKADALFWGDKLDNATGEITISDFAFVNSNDDGLHINKLQLVANNDTVPQNITITSDFFNGNIVGSYDFVGLVPTVQNILAESLPSLIKRNDSNVKKKRPNDFEFDFTLEPNDDLQKILRLPVNIVYKTTLEGDVNESEESFSINVIAPYLQQGKKIIEGTTLHVYKNADEQNVSVWAQTLYPMKKGKALVNINANGVNDRLDTELEWKLQNATGYRGALNLSTLFSRNQDEKLALNVDVNPTQIVINDTIWRVMPAKVIYDNGVAEISKISGVCDNQSIVIDGVVSKDPSDVLMVELNKMSLDYIFETLAIDNVMFGGTATGKFYAKNIMSGAPILETPNLHVEKIAYNRCLMGDADIKSNWDNETKGINITADLKQGNGLKSIIDGTIYPTRDSLSISFDAHKAQIGFLQPFMEAITSDIQGQVSGKATLYGTFHDMNLYGDIFADSLKFKVDYTNVYYTATDSVHIVPGLIEFNDIKIHDRYGKSAKVNGWLRHDYFHRPEFDFEITDARDFLCYDVTPKQSPDWYGTVFGNGSAYVKGGPGICEIGVNMETCDKSKFTFVLSNEEAAGEYNFITFVDRNKDGRQDAEDDGIPQIVKDLTAKNIQENSSKPSVFKLDIHADITNVAQLTVIMDPVGGDKIRGYGEGNLRLTYDSTDESLGMYGKYEIEKGSYNFTLQDIIIKDFIINQGGNISFNGDPYSANLDIKATYSLNANLLDLDESFASDGELNRTNVPVNAILMARGDMSQPEISFDMDFPTLTTDAARKVKSIVSTDDMMNRQILYLLALNRFYTPEYMGNTSRNNELASVASSTLSSQLSNMLGQLSENWSITPNFRSNKGDFSDMEVDLALSSQLLNNRLIFNGNFGYRDNTLNTKNSNFIGDFDIEYLLNRRGTIRLKAYNHFNDQNYYMRSAMTTQGVGVEFKFDFDNPFKRNRMTEVVPDTIGVIKNNVDSDSIK